MATAIYHSDRGTKSALILVKNHALELDSTPCYVSRDAVAHLSEGESFEIPDGFSLIPMLEEDNKTPRTTKDGAVLLKLSYRPAVKA